MGYPPGYGAPPGYAVHPQGGPPPAAVPPAGYGPPPGAAVAGAAPPGSAAGGGSDFSRERPDQYSAFVKMAIHPTRDGGTEVRLPDGMCRDKHVPDFLECLRCWLGHQLGDPRVVGRPWRLRCLDLSRNGLSDSSATLVLEQIQRFDLRVERLCLAGNGIQAKGLAKVSEYVWNCADALLELDISDNQVEADSTSGSTPGSDPVSALLRCLYNHPSYPQIVNGDKVVPLTLRLGGNRVKEPAKLLKGIEAKVGKSHVQIRPNPDPYEHVGKEFLSVCLPGFLEQAASGKKERTRRRDKSRSGRGHRRVRLTEAPAHVRGEEKEKKPRRAELVARNDLEEGAKAKKSRRKAAETPKEPDHWQPAGSPARSSSASRSPSSGAEQKNTAKVAVAAAAAGEAAAAAPAAGGAPGSRKDGLVLSEDAQKELQQEVKDKLSSFGGLPSEDVKTRDMLAEFVVCMAVAGKGPQEISGELEPFLAEEAAIFVKWFTKHTQKSKRPRAA